MILIFVILQLADVCTTLYALDRGGREVNPIMLRAFAVAGPAPALIVVKLCLIGLVYAAAINGWLLPYVLEGFCLFYVGIVANNLYQIRKLTK